MMLEIGKPADNLGESGVPKNAVNIDSSDESCSTIFECDWEVFVVKYDSSAAKFVGKMACCALAPV